MCIPVKYTLVRDLDARMDRQQFISLVSRQPLTNLDDVVVGPFVHLWVLLFDIVQYVQGKCTISSANLIYYEVLVWKVLEKVLRDEALGYRLAIVRLLSHSHNSKA